MKIAVVAATICMAIAPAAVAQTGGYPASPSHAVVGTNPDGTPRYGSEPGKDANPSQNTVGPGSAGRGDHRDGAPGPEGAARPGTGEHSGEAGPR